jgi:hypothetical protein
MTHHSWWRMVRSAPAVLLSIALAVLSACRPPATPSSVVDRDSLVGSWSVESRDEGGTAYSGILDVTKYNGDGVYSGELQMAFTGGDGVDRAVVENARITVNGTKVLVQCSKAVVLTENGEYNADNFLLTRVNQNVLQGIGKDSHSVDGTITMTRK